MGKMKEIRNKIKDILENEESLSDIVKIYKGMPTVVTRYPCVLLDWDNKQMTQRHKGMSGRQHLCYMSVIVLEKYTDYEKRLDLLSDLTDKIEAVLIDNRYLDGLENTTDDWSVEDVEVIEVIYEALPKPREFVLDSSEIKIVIKVGGK